jgi:hypothetical protein
MAEILGIGISHYPPLSGRDEDMANILKGRLADPGVPATAKDPANWPEKMRSEWGTDKGRTGAGAHRAAMLKGLYKARAAIDEFKPDWVLIWGDDQYENFREDIIPPFCVMAYEDLIVRPWADASGSAMFAKDGDQWGSGKPNVGQESAEHSFRFRGQREAGKYLASALIESNFDVAYAYKPLHHASLPHAYLNSVLYLDYARQGFEYPIVPFQINCYGRLVVSHKGFISAFNDRSRPLDPPSPSPHRIFDLGAAVARICLESPWRVALIASSSWSHAFLVDKTWRMQPDIAQDRELYDALLNRDFDRWRSTSLKQIEESGEQELLNWFALAGAVKTLDLPCVWSDFVETHLFNSSKVTAIFRKD